jgi:hypothetical protein
LIIPRSIAAEASPFCLDTKSTKKIKAEKSFHPQANTMARFSAGPLRSLNWDNI